MVEKKKALVLFSGGLDSRIAAKMMEDQGFEVHLAFVKLPFGGGCCNNLPCIFNFAQTQGFHLHITDATKGDKFMEYVQIVKNPKYGRGTAMNPRKDCKIFIFIEGARLMKELGADVLVTGEVAEQRPMSQKKKTMMFDDEVAGLSGKILRPLSAKVLPQTEYEKSGLVDRRKFLSIEGRQRKVQMHMAEKYKITYPQSGGGCLLCEGDYSRKLKFYYKYFEPRLPKYTEILLLKRGRMFKKDGIVVVSRNEQEGIFIEEVAKDLKWNVFKNEEIPGPVTIYEKSSDKEFVEELWEAYRGKDLDRRKVLDEYKV
jgi:tRNA U34 2-thiouridine synthase MnmA/TrmU